MPELCYRITAKLTALSRLRVGNGELLRDRIQRPAEADESQGATPGVATVFLDKESRPYIPGTTLKGWLHAFAQPLLGEEEDMRVLFGATDFGGCVRFLDAVFAADPPEATAENLGEDWSSQRHTCVASHVVIDRGTRTAVRNLLFFEEFVPAGTTFDLTFEVSGANERAAACLLQLLDQFSSGNGGPAPLGSSVADGWGKVQCSAIQVSSPSEEDFLAWLENADAPDALLMSVWTAAAMDGLRAKVDPLVPRQRELRIPIHLVFDGAFICNDPSRARKKNETEGDVGNFEPCRSGNSPVVPHSALRGSLRSQAEKILRTQGAANVPSPSVRAGEEGSLPVVRNREDCKKLDVISLLFGAPGWRSPISFHHQTVDRPGELLVQELAGLDRFSGTVGDRKFKARHFWKPAISMELAIDLAALEWAAGAWPQNARKALTLLAQALRDLAEGLVPLGFGTAKGWGRCHATIDPPTGEWPRDIDGALRDFFTRGFTSGAVPDLPVAEDATPLPRPVRAGEGHFFNPYHFHPAKPVEHHGAPTLADLKARNCEALTLDRYSDDPFTGYLDCLLTVETPLAIGSTQASTNGGPANVALYRRDGEVAIPATSLRGMLSAHFEALTKSALRVLDNQRYSVRQGMPQALSAIGVVVQREVAGKKAWYLKPLCLPTYDLGQKRLAPEWRTLLPTPVLKAYHGDRHQQIIEPAWIAAHPTWKPGDPLITRIGTAAALSWNPTGTDLLPPDALHRKHEFRVAVEPGAFMQAGIQRTLGAPGDQVPRTKKHELRIPAPNIQALFAPGATSTTDLVPIPDEVVARFERLAWEMSDQHRDADGKNVRPYVPAGTRPPRQPAKGKKPAAIKLQAGDLVYFDIEGKDPKVRVKAISFSAIWRQEVPKSTFDFFAHIDRDLLPMSDVRRRQANGAPRPDSEVPITPAERLFGFVEMREAKDTKTPLAALASRLSFTDGVYTGNCGPNPVYEPQRWKIQSTPKPPCAALYFYKEGGHDARGQYIAKTELGRDYHRPKGRKFYAHHAVSPELFGTNRAPWCSRKDDGDPDDNQRMRVAPVKAGAQFRFRIHFENLSQKDLDLLAGSLRPSPQARYKLGLGRPLGLGTVRLDPSHAAQVVNFGSRYQPGRLEEHLADHLVEWPVEPAANLADAAFLALTAKKYTGVEYPRVSRAADQHTPPQADGETKLFEWFVANDSGSGRFNNPPALGAAVTAMTSLEGRNAIEPLPVHDFTPSTDHPH